MIDLITSTLRGLQRRVAQRNELTVLTRTSIFSTRHLSGPEGFNRAETAYSAETGELSREAAHEFLLTEAEQIESDADATYVLDRLLDRGWLYEVEGQLRKTG